MSSSAWKCNIVEESSSYEGVTPQLRGQIKSLYNSNIKTKVNLKQVKKDKSHKSNHSNISHKNCGSHCKNKTSLRRKPSIMLQRLTTWNDSIVNDSDSNYHSNKLSYEQINSRIRNIQNYEIPNNQFDIRFRVQSQQKYMGSNGMKNYKKRQTQEQNSKKRNISPIYVQSFNNSSYRQPLTPSYLPNFKVKELQIKPYAEMNYNSSKMCSPDVKFCYQNSNNKNFQAINSPRQRQREKAGTPIRFQQFCSANRDSHFVETCNKNRIGSCLVQNKIGKNQYAYCQKTQEKLGQNKEAPSYNFLNCVKNSSRPSCQLVSTINSRYTSKNILSHSSSSTHVPSCQQSQILEYSSVNTQENRHDYLNTNKQKQVDKENKVPVNIKQLKMPAKQEISNSNHNLHKGTKKCAKTKVQKNCGKKQPNLISNVISNIIKKDHMSSNKNLIISSPSHNKLNEADKQGQEANTKKKVINQNTLSNQKLENERKTLEKLTGLFQKYGRMSQQAQSFVDQKSLNDSDNISEIQLRHNEIMDEHGNLPLNLVTLLDRQYHRIDEQDMQSSVARRSH